GQQALPEDPVEADPHDRFARMVTERRAGGEVDLVFSCHAEADVPVGARRDRPAGNDTPRHLDDLVDHVAVHLCPLCVGSKVPPWCFYHSEPAHDGPGHHGTSRIPTPPSSRVAPVLAHEWSASHRWRT